MQKSLQQSSHHPSFPFTYSPVSKTIDTWTSQECQNNSNLHLKCLWCWWGNSSHGWKGNFCTAFSTNLFARDCNELDKSSQLSLVSSRSRWWPTSFWHGLGLHPFPTQGSSTLSFKWNSYCNCIFCPRQGVGLNYILGELWPLFMYMQPPAKTAFVQLAFLISAHQNANQRHVCIMSAAYAFTPACLPALSFSVFKLFKQFKCSVHTTLHLNCLTAYHECWYKLS